MIDYPGNPLRSPFAPSVLATYRSASYMLRLFREHYEGYRTLMARMWPVWAKAIACAVCHNERAFMLALVD